MFTKKNRVLYYASNDYLLVAKGYQGKKKKKKPKIIHLRRIFENKNNRGGPRIPNSAGCEIVVLRLSGQSRAVQSYGWKGGRLWRQQCLVIFGINSIGSQILEVQSSESFYI